MLCRDSILSKTANYVSLYPFFNLRNLFYLISGNIYSTRTHDSMRISNGKWCWWSRSIGGKSALDYLIKVNGLSFVEAVEQIVGQAAIMPPVFASSHKEKLKTLLFPQANRCATQAVSYLHNRGISYELIDYCIHTGRIFESTPHHNVVFVGFDKQGEKRYASLRGIGGTRFMGDVNGSDKHYSFAIPTTGENSTVHLFESAVDLLSYATLCHDWKSENLLSLAGVYQPKKDIRQSKIPAALTRFLEDYPHIKTIVLHLDNDAPGRMAAKAIMTVLPKEYTVLNKPPPVGKDCNDYLLYRIRHRQNERTDER